MVCSCGLRVRDSKPGKQVWYCACRHCNFCHGRGIRKNDAFKRNRGGKKQKLPPLDPNASHGGHHYFPMSDEKHR